MSSNNVSITKPLLQFSPPLTHPPHSIGDVEEDDENADLLKARKYNEQDLGPLIKVTVFNKLCWFYREIHCQTLNCLYRSKSI